MKNQIKNLLLAAAIAVVPGVASAVVITSSGVSGTSTCTGPGQPGAYQIDVLSGATFNATFDDGDAAGTFCFDLFNNSTTAAAITVAVASVNQGTDPSGGLLWGFDGGVMLTGAGPNATIAEGENWSDSFTFNIAPFNGLVFDWTWGTATATGFAKPDIDFTVFASPVPVPAAVLLFGSGLLGLVGIARRKKA